MTFFVLLSGFLVVLVLLASLATAGRLPDTHDEVTQHGDYRF